MAQRFTFTLIAVLISVGGVLGGRASSHKDDFAPALAADQMSASATSTARSVAIVADESLILWSVARDDADVVEPVATRVAAARVSADVGHPAELQAAPEPEVTVVPAVVAPPAPRTAAQPIRTPAPTAAPVAPAPAVAAQPTCPATWFCYPRLGIAGAIVPYSDCSGSTDVGTAIRSYNCLSDHYLMGHAYTQFGLVRQWAAGDIVFAWGQRFTVTGAITQQSCGAPSFPLAALSMQTSLTSSACGAVLVVQAR